MLSKGRAFGAVSPLQCPGGGVCRGEARPGRCGQETPTRRQVQAPEEGDLGGQDAGRVLGEWQPGQAHTALCRQSRHHLGHLSQHPTDRWGSSPAPWPDATVQGRIHSSQAAALPSPTSLWPQVWDQLGGQV